MSSKYGRAQARVTPPAESRPAPLQNALSAALVALALSSPTMGQSDAGEDWVTPAQGPSLLATMNRGTNRSSLGRNGMLTSRLPAGGVPARDPTEVGGWLTRGFDLEGGDLYRINCRACHRAGGEGLPPEVNPILDPVRASSPAQLEAQMAERGRKVSPEMTRRMADRAELSLRHRLSEGGEVMAPFGHLKPEEVDALLGYLDFLAGVRDKPPSGPAVPQRAARVGEHVVKAVCLICHDSRRVQRPANDNELPALVEITEEYSISQVIRKVRDGVIGDQQRTRGRMPRFPFLAPEEIAAAYIYLAGFPPVADP